jgi:hypothetical protein
VHKYSRLQLLIVFVLCMLCLRAMLRDEHEASNVLAGLVFLFALPSSILFFGILMVVAMHLSMPLSDGITGVLIFACAIGSVFCNLKLEQAISKLWGRNVRDTDRSKTKSQL